MKGTAEEGAKRHQKSEKDAERTAPGGLEDGDSLAVIDRALQNGRGLIGCEMVKRSKQDAKAIEALRNGGGVHRLGAIADGAAGGCSGALEGAEVGVLVREADIQWLSGILRG